ncbi:uncharacterized protein LOC62_04G006597 [Vanrija pseudolonga]|uniref:BTB domain-containing protein n=1 Tax=Vanrija pseudolonga TaxID=143232 RepID=A0AAF0YEM1_9TREE|nr:hypothetical protein LOC62_04G006597 [Vanrija pseudolonga]
MTDSRSKGAGAGKSHREPSHTAADGALHPQFSTGADLAIFESSDGVRFKFSLHLLAGLSTFFHGLLGVPTLPGLEADPMPLPSADGETLALCFSLIQQQTSARSRPPNAGVAWPTPHILEQVIDVVKAYDLPIVADVLLRRSRGARGWKALAMQRFLLAAATESAYLALARRDTLWCDLSTLGEFEEGMFSLLDGSMVFELFAFHRRWADGVRDLVANLSKRCKGLDCDDHIVALHLKLLGDKSLLKGSARTQFVKGVPTAARDPFKDELDGLMELLANM